MSKPRRGIGLLLVIAWLFFLILSHFFFLRAVHWIAENKNIYSGYYSFGFETSSFVPCGKVSFPGYGSGYWLKALPASEFFQSVDELLPNAQVEDWSYISNPIYVQFVGRLSRKTDTDVGYGHLGQYEREITVIRLLTINRSHQIGKNVLYLLLEFVVVAAFLFALTRYGHAYSSLAHIATIVRDWWMWMTALFILFAVAFIILQRFVPTIGCT